MSQSETQKPTFDPFEMWRQLYEANEQAWTKTIKDLTTTKDYAEAQGKLLESMLAFQKMMRESMSSQLNSVNIPTRDDVARLGELILSLEEKVDRLDDQMVELTDKVGEVAEKVAGMEKRVEKMAALEKSVEAVDQRIERLSDRLPERVARQVQKEVEAAEAEPEKTAKPRGKAEK